MEKEDILEPRYTIFELNDSGHLVEPTNRFGDTQFGWYSTHEKAIEAIIDNDEPYREFFILTMYWVRPD